MMKRLSMSQLFALMTLGFALGMLSGTLEPALLGYKVLELAPERRNTALGTLTFAGLLIAMITQPVIGALSDRTHTRWRLAGRIL
jgi:MFS family permease